MGGWKLRAGARAGAGGAADGWETHTACRGVNRGGVSAPANATIRAPWSATSRAVHWPMPDDAPVITITCRSNDFMPRSGSQGTNDPRGPSSFGSSAFRELARLDRSELRRLMRRGVAVAPAEVAGAVFRGWNTARLSSLLLSRKFLKRFHAPGPNGLVRGENVLARQNSITAPWRPRFGARGLMPFVVMPPDRRTEDDSRRGLVISYGGWPGRGRLNPLSHVVDYVVRPPPDRPGLLLGASWFEIGAHRVFLEHFVLERV